MRIFSFLFDLIGFGIGIPIGLLLGFFIFIYSEPDDVKDPIIKPLNEIDTGSLIDLLHEIPPWVKHPDYERIDWFNKALYDMWPYLDKAICGIIRSTAKPIFAEYIGQYQIKSIEFETLTLGSLPPTVYGKLYCMRVHESNEKELVFEPAIRWAGNPHITVVLKLLFFRITAQLVDVQIFAAPRIILRPLVPSFPCFANITATLIDKEFIRRQVASLYLWPQTLEIPILDGSLSGAIKKPVGILHVKVVRALKLLKMDIIGSSDPYVKIKLSGERLPSKKTTIKMRNLNPEWNENFKLTVKDPQSQVLQFDLYDWEQIGTHDFLGMQIVPLKVLAPLEKKELTLDLVKNTNPYDPQNKKGRGQLVVELTYNPFIEDNAKYSGPLDANVAGGNIGRRRKSSIDFSFLSSLEAAGLLSVTVQGAEGVGGKNHTNPNPYCLVSFGSETKITKMLRKTQRPSWNEEFQFVLEEASLKDKIHIEVKKAKKIKAKATMTASTASLALPSLSPKTLALYTPKPTSVPFYSVSSSSLTLGCKPISISASFLNSGRFQSASSRFVRNVAVSSEFEQDEEVLSDDGEASFAPDLKLFVGNLPFSVDSAQLAGLFESAGNVEMVEVIYDKTTGRSRGFGFVTMSSVQEAEGAARQLNGYELDGRALRVNYGPPPPRSEDSFRGARGGGGGSDSSNRLYVGNLAWGVDNLALENLFSEQGKVLEAKVVYDRDSGRSRGFGFVTYGTADEMNSAIESLDGVDLNGRSIRVTAAEPRPRRQLVGYGLFPLLFVKNSKIMLPCATVGFASGGSDGF
ncbi:hypothetical protein ACE6H2_021290 [Prunus campanulata]